MKRNIFIKSLGLAGLGLVLPTGIQGAGSGVLIRPVKIYDNHIKGTHYYAYRSCFMDIQVGDVILLKRVTKHQHDSFAIEVYWQKKKLGYVPAFENVVLANLMDAGVKLESRVTGVPNSYSLAIGIWADLILNGNAEAPLTRAPADEAEDIYRNGGYGI